MKHPHVTADCSSLTLTRAGRGPTRWPGDRRPLAQKPALGWKPQWLAAGAVAGPAIFTSGWLVLGFFSPGFYRVGGDRIAPYSPLSQSISGLGVGPTAPLMNMSFVLGGILTLIGLSGVAGSLHREPGDLPYRTLFVLLGLPALGAVIDGVFTLRHNVEHSLGFALALTSIAGLPVCGSVLRRTNRWRGFGAFLIGGGPLTLALTVAFVLTFHPTTKGIEAGFGGLSERILVSEIMAWYVALAWRTLASSGPGDGHPPIAVLMHEFPKRGAGSASDETIDRRRPIGFPVGIGGRSSVNVPPSLRTARGPPRPRLRNGVARYGEIVRRALDVTSGESLPAFAAGGTVRQNPESATIDALRC